MKAMDKTLIPCCMSLTLFSTSVFASEEANKESAWQHSIEIYAMAVNIRGDTKVKNISEDVDVDPKFILDNLDMAAMLHWESLYNNTWGLYLDYAFMDLSGKKESELQESLGVIKGSLGIRQGVLEAKVFKRYQYEFGSIDYMAGIRWWDNDFDASVGIEGPNNGGTVEKQLDVDWVDYLIGARFITPISKNWQIHLSGDIGMSADTSFTSSLQTGFRYTINTWSDLNIAYRSTWVDYDNEETFAYDTATQGFLIGWAAHF